jgi:hypothetical protein
MNETKTELTPLLNEHEYCRITGESLGTARRNRRLKKGCQFVKLNALVRYRAEDVRVYIDRNVRTTSSQVAA